MSTTQRTVLGAAAAVAAAGATAQAGRRPRPLQVKKSTIQLDAETRQRIAQELGIQEINFVPSQLNIVRIKRQSLGVQPVVHDFFIWEAMLD